MKREALVKKSAQSESDFASLNVSKILRRKRHVCIALEPENRVALWDLGEVDALISEYNLLLFEGACELHGRHKTDKERDGIARKLFPHVLIQILKVKSLVLLDNDGGHASPTIVVRNESAVNISLCYGRIEADDLSNFSRGNVF